MKHTCNVCQKCAEWDSGWEWYGSIAMEEDGLPVLKTCSEKCRSEVDDPARWLLLLWGKVGAKPSKKILKNFRKLPEEAKDVS